MNADRIQEINAEMCGLADEQTRLLKSCTGSLADMSGEEVDGYTQRNDRLRELIKELSDLSL